MKEKIKLILMRADRSKLQELAIKLDKKQEISITIDYFTMLKKAMI